MEIVTGSYEEVLLGLHFNQEADDGEQLTDSFTEETIGSIRCVAVSDDGLLASGGSDEIIRIYDLKKQCLIDTLTHHSGTVTSLQFHDTHLFSTSDDGTLCLWRLATWEPERTFKGHKGPVRHVAVHPSGKITLTVGQDKTLRLWNNVTGRIAYISNLKEPAELVAWSPAGLYYVICYKTHLEVFSVESKGLIRSIVTPQKVNSILFVSDTVIVYGGEGKIRDGEREKAALFFTDILEGNTLLRQETDCERIRGVSVCDKWMAVVGSDGQLGVYQFTAPEQGSMTVDLVASRKISLRFTSVAMFNPSSKQKKTKLDATKVPEKSPQKMKRKEKVNKKKQKTIADLDQRMQAKKKKLKEKKRQEITEDPDQSMQAKKKLKEKKKRLGITEDPDQSMQAKKKLKENKKRLGITDDPDQSMQAKKKLKEKKKRLGITKDPGLTKKTKKIKFAV